MNVKIITEGLPNDSEVLLDEAKISYVQNPDCTEDRDSDWQKITISIRNNGIANFLNFNTENWSFDDTSSIVTIIEDFKKRINYNDKD